nr:ORF2 [Torque teno felis virus]
MQRPLPGPNVMLPAINLSDSPDLDSVVAFKRREAKWKQLISYEHKKWCLCGSYMNHFVSSSQPLCGEEKENPGGAAENGGGNDDISDADIIAAGGDE